MPRLLIDATALSVASKGVGRYAAGLIRELSGRLGDDWRIYLTIVEHDYKGLPSRTQNRTLRIPLLSEFSNGLMAIPLLAWIYRIDYLLLPADAVTAIGKRPTIAIVHDIPRLIADATNAPVSLWRRTVDEVKRLLRSRMLRKCAVVVCNSNFTATEAVREYGIHPSRIKIGYCGIDARFYAPPKLRVWDWITEPCVKDPYLLTFATGDSRERYDLCPEIFSLARARFPQLKLVIVGVEQGKSYARQLRKDLEAGGLRLGLDFILVPFLTEAEFDKLHSLYRDAAFYLELSAHEGFGMSLAEAMACGTTCVSSGAGALDEIGGGFPLRAPRHTADSFAEVIVEGLRQGAHMRENVEQVSFTRRYCWRQVGDLVAKELTRIHGHRTQTLPRLSGHDREKPSV